MASPGRGARNKGAAFERHIAKTLTEATGLLWQRGLSQSRGGGRESSDVGCDMFPGIHIECKNHMVTNIKAAYRQAVEDCEGSTKIPVAITKDTRTDILVTMKLEDWIQFLNLMIKPAG